MPLSAYADNASFKIYMVDTGLLYSKFDIAANVIIDELDFIIQDSYETGWKLLSQLNNFKISFYVNW
ncbi:hypothetical protein OXPF_36400 [Oxobacter pfennigii]|uniref:Uncharacterized protein n=1 Tax=Oxobacter pfennigii TaxID=36849 RepID=A0A0N8NSS8_9CLOT|nr:hypothetical protein [Oxobacter pfennigii]KPU42872.1 hypothetical protein OXPF_36400 [Oxobacter pfennigii]